MKKTHTLLVAGLLTFSMMSSAATKTLIFCSEGSPENFSPQMYTAGTSADATAWTVYSRLVGFAAGTTNLIPSLAERWEISDDGKTYTFFLRKGVKFHSNKLFTPTRDFNADDVIFTFMRQKDPNHPYHHVSNGTYSNFESLEFGQLITDIERVDDHTVRFHLTQPDATFLPVLGWYFASILSAEYADSMMKAGTPEKVDSDPLGTGPFQLMQYQKDSRLLYQAFPHYWQGKPELDRLVFSITPDASVRYAKLEKNECQIMAYPNPADLPRIAANPNVTLLQKAGLNTGFLSFNTQRPPLDNVKVRQALSLAINQPAIIEAVFQGTGQAAKNLLPPGVWSAMNDVEPYPYSPEQARALLREAGFADGSIAIELWAMPVQRPYNPNARRMAEMIQADWAKVGVKAKIVSYEWGEYLQRVRRGEHDTVLLGWTTSTGDPDNFFGPLFTCTSANGGSNSSRWCHAPFDAIIQQARITSDHQKRVELYQQAQEMMRDQAPAYMIAHATIFEPVRKEVKGYEIDPFSKHIFYQVKMP